MLDRARPPILTFGNSDADRECAYRVGPIGRLETARADAEQQG